MVIEFMDMKIRNPYLSLALDEALIQFYHGNKSFLGGIRLWRNNLTIVLGRSCKIEKNIKRTLYEKLLVSHKKSEWLNRAVVSRRASGGGTVLHGPGIINYTILLPLRNHPELYHVRKSYDILLAMIKQALAGAGVESVDQGLSDIAIKDNQNIYKKISGNAQIRKMGLLLLHGTLIQNKNMVGLIARYLLHPPDEPEYRNGRNHGDFIGVLPDNFDTVRFYDSLKESLLYFVRAAETTIPPQSDRRTIFQLAKKLALENYGKEQWILYGRHPAGLRN